MSLEIKTASLEPVRHTFAHIARRFGDKPATRYQEATHDVPSQRPTFTIARCGILKNP